jgi:hypothetical protein
MTLLSHTPSQVLRQAIIDLGLGSDGGSTWPVWATGFIDKPDDAIAVIDTTNVPRGRFMIGGEVQQAYGVQVLVRANDVEEAWLKADQVLEALTQSTHLLEVVATDSIGTGSQTYTLFNVNHRSGPLPVHDPDSDRKMWSLNFVATLR